MLEKKASPPGEDSVVKKSSSTKKIINQGITKLKDVYEEFREEGAQEKESIVSTEILRLASFDIWLFSNTSRDNEELRSIANILKYHDLIAIQGVKDEKVLTRLVDILRGMGYSYQYELSPPLGKNTQDYHAFLYRDDRVTLVKTGKLYSSEKNQLSRAPFYASFKSGNFDFTLVSVYIPDMDDLTLKRREILSLADVYNDVQNEDVAEQDVLLLGDFNIAPDDKSWEPLKAIPTMTYLIKPPSTTLISDTGITDNFWFPLHYVKEYTGISGVNKFDETIYGNDDTHAKRAVSNHRPIWAKFDITMDDDD